MITALHGFLGRPHDWTSLFGDHPLADQVSSIDLLTYQPISELWKWAKEFNDNIRKRSTPDVPNIIMGYSLGGRLAMHALIDDPQLWQGAVIISSHLGLISHNDKVARKSIDDYWAHRFENDAWNTLMQDWNQREVFVNDTFKFARCEHDYLRSALSTSLRNWSLSQQDDLSDKMCQLKMPILWMAGSDDATFVNQGKRLQGRLLNSKSEIKIIPDAGHRVPWQYPQQFLSELSNFVINSTRNQCQ